MSHCQKTDSFASLLNQLGQNAAPDALVVPVHGVCRRCTSTHDVDVVESSVPVKRKAEDDVPVVRTRSKTVRCRFFELGVCRDGAECFFSHDFVPPVCTHVV